MNPGLRLGAGAALLAALLGCTVSEPAEPAWRDQARQTLDDVASQVATARLTLVQLEEGRLPAPYGVVVLADAEEAASTAEESLATAQPPPPVATLSDRVLGLVGRAVEAVQAVRETVVAERYDVPALVKRLDRLVAALDRRRASL